VYLELKIYAIKFTEISKNNPRILILLAVPVMRSPHT